MIALVLARASIAPGRLTDLAVVDGRLVDPGSVGADHERIDLDGRAVVPGLVDHHTHLFALAAAGHSVDLSPDVLVAAGGLMPALRAARNDRPAGWLRALGYDVATSGPIDRYILDAAGVGPIRVQDRTGVLWILDSRGLAAVLSADAGEHPAGIEVVDGEPNGVLTRLDDWLRHRLPATRLDLDAVGRCLAGRGITGVTDAGADNTRTDLQALHDAQLPFRVEAMTRDPMQAQVGDVKVGPVKILLDDADLPSLEDLTIRIASAHAAGRTVAVHCVTTVQVVLAVTAGIGPADRIEHASLVPDELMPLLVAAGPTVVVQPGLVHTRGDRYLREVDPVDRHGLHRLATFRRAGLRVAASSDAPYGPADPWLSIRTAVERRTAYGAPFGPTEAVTPLDAVSLFTGSLHDPSTPRALAPGAVADLVVLDATWDEVAASPAVSTTVRDGVPISGDWPR